MNFKVQILLILVLFKKVSTVKFLNPKNTPSNLSLYRYEGNFYPVYAASKTINLNPTLHGNLKPITNFARYLNPVHLSQQIYHYTNLGNHQTLSGIIDDDGDDATGSEYQVAMKVQPLQQVASSGKPQDIVVEESGKSQAKRQLKIDKIMSPEKMQSFRNGFYNNKNENNDVQMKSVPNKMTDTITRHYHDIFLNYKSPQDLVFGHVLSWPELAQKRLEKRNNNHFKGQVIWADKTGGYGEHYWDLAQGAL